MKENTSTSSLKERKVKLENMAVNAIKNPVLLDKIVTGVSSETAETRFESANILKIISERKPETLYSKWNFFMELLDSKNTILKWIAMDIIANLASVDVDDRFRRLFKKYYGYLHEGSLITAAHVVDNLGKIALFKPELRNAIAEELLKVETVPLPTEECRNILIGKTISAFQAFYDKTEAKDKVAAFVKRHLKNPRKSTRAKAERFMRRFADRYDRSGFLEL